MQEAQSKKYHSLTQPSLAVRVCARARLRVFECVIERERDGEYADSTLSVMMDR